MNSQIANISREEWLRVPSQITAYCVGLNVRYGCIIPTEELEAVTSQGSQLRLELVRMGLDDILAK